MDFVHSFAIKHFISEALAAVNGTISMNNNRLVNVGYPSAASDAATKQYVDDRIASLPPPGLQTGDIGATMMEDNPNTGGCTGLSGYYSDSACLNSIFSLCAVYYDGAYYEQDPYSIAAYVPASGSLWRRDPDTSECYLASGKPNAPYVTCASGYTRTSWGPGQIWRSNCSADQSSHICNIYYCRKN